MCILYRAVFSSLRTGIGNGKGRTRVPRSVNPNLSLPYYRYHKFINFKFSFPDPRSSLLTIGRVPMMNVLQDYSRHFACQQPPFVHAQRDYQLTCRNTVAFPVCYVTTLYNVCMYSGFHHKIKSDVSIMGCPGREGKFLGGKVVRSWALWPFEIWCKARRYKTVTCPLKVLSHHFLSLWL